MRRVLVALGTMLSACHGPLRVEVDVDRSSPTLPPWVLAGDLVERTTAAADAAARVWGGSPSDLDDWTIRIVDHPACGEADCWAEWSDTGGGTITLDAYSSVACIEASCLPHEIGHAVGLHGHSDPRWRDPEFWSAMRGAMGSTVPGDDAACSAIFRDFVQRSR